MARTAEDVRLLFEITAGHDGQDPFSAPVPVRRPEPAGLRIGLMERFNRVPVQPAIAAAVAAAGRVLADLGFAVEPFEPRGIERAPNLWWFFFGEVAAPFIKRMIAGRDQEVHWTGMELVAMALEKPAPTFEQVVENLGARDAMRAALLRQMREVPVLLLPACGVAAFPHRTRRWPAGDKEIGLFEAMMPLTFSNLLGLPALVIPFGWTDEGLPVGVQLVAAPYGEELLLELAVRMEEARGPFGGPRA
jgi:Asp-tRNA(Asn)/Glu-tRNA(Gln) amidotransferase A subunit family amidase